MRRYFALAVIATAAHLLGGCSALGYYHQGLAGQIDLMRRSQPIAAVLSDRTTAPVLRQQLQQVLAIRSFAIYELLLPDNGSYLEYADLERPYVVWNLFAVPEFSLKPLQSCFPLVGCLSYRGYFRQEDAMQRARQLAAKGNDVFVGGVAAYSTLGWLDDPVLSSMLRWNETRIARLIFHELAHQKLYAADDSDFNEAFATAVSDIGVERWLQSQGSQQALQDWALEQSRRTDFLALVHRTAGRLRRLYAMQADAAAMRSAKAEIFAAMRAEHGRIRASRWAGYDGYDDWFANVNNARIAAVATYHALVPGFRQRYAELGQDLPAFYAASSKVAGLPRPQRRAWLQLIEQTAGEGS